MEKTLRVINSLESEGIIGRYAIGGAFGLLFFAEPAVTFDVDVFCHLPQPGLLVDLAPLYKHLTGMGYETEDEHVRIEGVPVQFLPPTTPLVEEALENAVEMSYHGVSTRVFSYEYLLAIMAETNRPKDRLRIAVSLESATPDMEKLKSILSKHKLLDRWATIVT